MKSSFLWPVLGVLIGCLFWSSSAVSGSGTCDYFTRSLTLPAPQMEVSIPEDTTDKGIQLSQPSLSGRLDFASCSGTDASGGFSNVKLASAGFSWSDGVSSYPVYKTAVTGVGYAIGVKTPLTSGKFISVDRSSFYNSTRNDNEIPEWVEFSVWYISTGPIKSGVYSMPTVVAIESVFGYNGMNGSGNTWTDVATGTVSIGGGDFVYSTLGCDLVDSQVNVNMGQISASKYLKGVGSVAPAELFSIPLQCRGKVAIDMLISSSGAADVSKSLLKVATGGATGVAIQMLQSDGVTLFPLGKDVRILAETVDGRNDVNLAARYYQNASKVVPGKAKGVAQFTLKYR